MLEGKDHLKRLMNAGLRASSLGIAVMDFETRVQLINAVLARESNIAQENCVGKTPRDIVGRLALQFEPACQRALRTGIAENVLFQGQVRDAPAYGYWLGHCFPVMDGSRRVQQLGMLVVNLTAEKASREIFDMMATDSRRLMADAAGLLTKFDESIRHYHASLKQSFDELACPFTETPRKVAILRSSILQLDNEIEAMRQLIYSVMSHFSISEC
jgi:hypothetical protein